jgi:cell division protein FtsZ
VIDQGAGDEVRVTVIATGFGPERYRRRRREREAQPVEEGVERERERPTTEDAFELPDDILEVPSFLREP